MFERFTSRARHSIVLAQDEAREMQHNYIGTEHILLGLLGEPEGIAGQALAPFGLTLTVGRERVLAAVGQGKKRVEGHIPFTPRAKKILELALREALALHHNYIGTEHILLGLIREGDGVGAQIVRDQAGDPLRVRMAVLDLVPAGRPEDDRRWLRWLRPRQTESGIEPESLHTTGAVDASLAEATRIAGGAPIGSHHVMLATLTDPNSAAARVLASLGVDLDRALAALRDADVTGTTDEVPEQAGRRQMQLEVAEDRVSVMITDPALVTLAGRTVEALGDAVGDPPGVIRGDLPAAVSLAGVWRAVEASLHDIRRRADPAGSAPAEADG